MLKPCLTVISTLVMTMLATGTVRRAELPGFAYWGAKELAGYPKILHGKVAGDLKFANQKLADYGTSNVAVAHREASGIVEIHAQFDDYFVVQAGEATLAVGGEAVNPRLVEPGETRADSIKGGETRRLLPGDIVHIPATMPHQLRLDKGKQFTYFVIKVKVG